MTTTAKARRLVYLAAGWAIFDAVIHVLIDQVEPLRITGNLITVLAAVAVRFQVKNRSNAMVCFSAAIAVLLLNIVWLIGVGELRVPALVFFGVAVFLLGAAGRLFLIAGKTPAE